MIKSPITCLLAIILLTSCVSPLKSYKKAQIKAPFDVIIVPGIPFQNQDWGSNIMKSRVLWSFFLYSRGLARNIIYSGSAVYSPWVESKIMAHYAQALGVPVQHIYTETRAEHSTENLVYSLRMARDLGLKNIAVATDPGQSNALKLFAWDYGLPVSFIPVISDSLHLITSDSTVHIDPSSAFTDSFIPLPERESFIKRIAGTLGLRIR